MTTPHPGLVAAAALAGSRRKLAEIAGCEHGTINYYWRTGKALPMKWAAPIASKLRLPLDKLVGKEA